jgi:hypothetical protein
MWRMNKRRRRAAALEAAREYFIEWGRKGGKERTQQLKPEERKTIAAKAAAARWKGVSPAERSKILRRVVKARWKKAKEAKTKRP